MCHILVDLLEVYLVIDRWIQNQNTFVNLSGIVSVTFWN